MASRIHLATDYQPDFGVPYPLQWRKDFDQLSDEEIIQLAGVKQSIDSGIEINIPSLPPRLQLQSTRLLIEHNATEDPIEYGWTLDSWREVNENWRKYVSHFILGGNRSAKSSYAARLVVWALMHIPECRVRCYQVNDEKSVVEQQAYIWEALPARFKNMAKKRGQTHTINYTQATGFTGNKLILPPLPGYERGGECIFGTYAQYRNDPQIVESFWCHLAWLDEECEQKMYERMLYRIKDANGRLVNTFTTIKGWTPLVEEVIGKARTIKRRYAPLLKREIPIGQESAKRQSTRIYYFWTEDNPFLPDNTMDSFKGRPDDEIKATAYGIPTKNAISTFAQFDEDIHVIKHEDIPFLKLDYKGKVTRYQSIDPAGDKPWFWIYAAVDAFNRIIIYAEYPDESYGTWGEPGNTPEGNPGTAQKMRGTCIDEYVEKMRYMEEGDEIFERIIDTRLGNTPQQVRDGAVTIIGELEDAGLVITPSMGTKIDPGLDLIKNALRWDTTKELGPTNLPRLRISDRCQNLIECFKNYSNYNTNEVWKDGIDTVRYLLECGCDHVSDKAMQSTGQTFSY